MCVATHYEGDPTDNTKDFHKWFKQLIKEKQQPFSGMKYTIFGLGDKSYELYNEMGIYFDSSYEKLGAKRLYPLGASDAEAFTTEDDFLKWKENIWQELFKEYEGQSSE